MEIYKTLQDGRKSTSSSFSVNYCLALHKFMLFKQLIWQALTKVHQEVPPVWTWAISRRQREVGLLRQPISWGRKMHHSITPWPVSYHWNQKIQINKMSINQQVWIISNFIYCLVTPWNNIFAEKFLKIICVRIQQQLAVSTITEPFLMQIHWNHQNLVKDPHLCHQRGCPPQKLSSQVPPGI